MAAEVTIGGDGKLFVGEDKTIRMEPRDVYGVPIDTNGWVIDMVVAKTDKADAMVTKHTTVSGTFNADPEINTHKRVAQFTDEDMNLFKEATYRHSWKRMDDASETVLAYGDFTPQKATAP